MDTDPLGANIQRAERTLDAGDCRFGRWLCRDRSWSLMHADLMDEREHTTKLEDPRGDERGGGWLRTDHLTGFAALAATLLVALGVGTARKSQGSASDATLGHASHDPLGAAGVGGDSHGLVPTSTPLLPPSRGELLFRGSLLPLLVPERFGRSLPDDLPSTTTDAPNMRAYNGRPIRRVAVLRMRVTAYSPDERSCGSSADGITASGYSVLTNGGFLVAADPRVLPLGSLVCVPGYDDGAVVPVLDTGGAIKGNRLDVLYPTHELAVQWGVQELDVEVWDYADGLPSGFRRMRRPAK